MNLGLAAPVATRTPSPAAVCLTDDLAFSMWQAHTNFDSSFVNMKEKSMSLRKYEAT